MTLESILLGYRLTIADITYFMPDYPTLLQSFIWQYEDIAPDFPRLKQFLDFWDKSIDGSIYKVEISSTSLIKTNELVYAQGQWLLH